MTALVVTTRSVKSDQSNSLIQCMKILELSCDRFSLLTPTKTDASAKEVSRQISLPVDQVPPLDYDSILAGKKDWLEVYESLDVSFLEPYDRLFIFGGLHYPQSNLTRFTERAKFFPVGDRGQIKFMQFAKNVVNIMAVYKAHVEQKKHLHELSYDTDEFNSARLNVGKHNRNMYFNYHVYPINRYNMYGMDALQYWHKTSSERESLSRFGVSEKNFDMVFGYTLYDYGDRPSYVDWIDDMASKFPKCTSRIYCKNAIDKEASHVVDKETYLWMLSMSKYTMIIPSYDANCFSFYRFIEAISRDCLPILHPKCYTADVEYSFMFSLERFKNLDPLKLTEEERQDLVNQLKEAFLTRRTFVDLS